VLRLIRSHSIEDLAGALAADLAASRPPDPIQPQQVLVSTNAMGRWLALAISERLGICAGIDFDFGGRHLRRLLRDLAAQPEGPDPWDPETLRWRLAAVLDGLPDTAPWQPLRQLWQRPDLPAGQLDGRRLQLLLALADTLDQYGLYRPGPLRRWLAGDDSGFDGRPLADDQRWQPTLLRVLQEQAAAEGFDHPAERLRQRPRPSPQGPPPPLHVFGLTSLPPPFLQLLGQLVSDARRPVHLYVLSACLDPWGALPLPPADRDDPVTGDALLQQLEDTLLQQGQRLLIHLGRSQRDFAWQLELLRTDLQEAVDDRALPTPPPAADADLLTLLRDDLLHGRARSALNPAVPPLTLTPARVNVQVISCSGDRRQVEEARAAVLALMAADPGLEPRHVLLMTADVPRFAPLVLTVFERPRGPADPEHLPVRVTDRTLRQRNGQVNLLFQLLDLAGSRLEPEPVVDLLMAPDLAGRFGLDRLDHRRLLALLQETGLRWGRDGAHRRRWGYPADDSHTWRWALDRLLLGLHLQDPFPLGDPGEGEWQGLAAAPRIDPAVVHGLLDACGTLFEVLEPLEAPAPAAGWERALANGVQRLLGEGDNDGWQAPEVHGLLSPLRHPDLGTRLLDRQAVRTLLEEAEGQDQGRYGHVSGAVTLSALEPMRSIPHRVVVLLGLDADRLPRRDEPAAFDLMARHPWRGDRSRRQEDRGILLEALLASRDHLIATYTGRDACSGASLEPAGPLADLLRAIDTGFRADDGQSVLPWVQRQAPPLPLRPVAAPAAPLWPVGWEWPPAADTTAATTDGSDHLEALQRFFSDPAAALLQAHGIAVARDPREAWDPEEPELDGLARWRLLERLGQRPADELLPPAWEALQGSLRRRGDLPAGAAAAIAASGPRRRSLALRRLAAQLESDWPEAVTVVQAGRWKPRSLLKAWIAHLAGQTGDGRATVLLGSAPDTPRDALDRPVWALALPPLAAEAASARLHELETLRQQGLRRPLPFAPDPSWTLLQELEPSSGLDARGLRWFAPEPSTPPPASVRQLWDGEAPDWEPLRQDPRAPELALQVLLPLSEALDAGRQLLTPTCRDPWQPLEEPEP